MDHEALDEALAGNLIKKSISGSAFKFKADESHPSKNRSLTFFIRFSQKDEIKDGGEVTEPIHQYSMINDLFCLFVCFCDWLKGEEEFPTLLHFAARFGFERLTWTLLDCPGSAAALNIRNNQNLSVMQLAEAHGQTVILNYLRSYLAVMVTTLFSFTFLQILWRVSRPRLNLFHPRWIHFRYSVVQSWR